MALDVDGTLVDTNSEYYNRVREAWQYKYGSSFPLSYEQISSLRPWVEINDRKRGTAA